MKPGQKFDFEDIVKTALSYQDQMQSAQAELERALITGRSEDGTVTVLCNGMGKVSAVKVDPRVFDERDREKLQRAIVEAIQAAGKNAGNAAAQRMGDVQVSLS
ncbi:YbaB/EbfC family nucleoid-associated protein [Jidongwangia harbinensis]|uniref:YbaB/EbfC family nucleoid-associated protein n=1 Tax=Jidongwangia harbinensis TaxID=2878561 RepID=UPI001CDA1D3D|nr:YbaB/EbfC family nucleoid-associated protein [Jidongwangia harbinensis]MCA2217463.1 YbaB/EbfC family nucleoid-associated protein [Jidongwangia harbinensis]